MCRTEVFNSVIEIIGGLALFLYGAQESARFFRQELSGNLKEGLGRLTGSGSRSFLFGALLAAVAQSSAIAISFGIGFVDAGILSLADSIMLVMGASLGGTIVSVLLSFNIFDYAPALFAGAFLLSKARKRKIKMIGGVLKSICIIFLGMMFLRSGAASLFEDERVRGAVLAWSSFPLLMGVASFTFAAVFQSRSAIIGIGIALAISGVLPANSALPIALGAHMGSSLIAVISSFEGRMSARRLGFCSLVYYSAGSLTFLLIMTPVHRFMLLAGLNVVQELVLGQILVALLNIIIFLPLTSLLSDLSVRLVKISGDLDQPMYLEEEMLSVPSVAVLLLSREMARLSNYLEAYLQMLMLPLERKEGLFERLPAAIEELSNTCQDYSYKINLNEEDPKLRVKFSSVSRTMSILRSMSKSLCSEISEILRDESVHSALRERSGSKLWNEWTALSAGILRTSLRAFVLGERGLSRQTAELEGKYGTICREIRDEITSGYSYGRNVSKGIRVISLMQGFLGMSEVLAEDADVCTEELFEEDERDA